MLKRKWLIYTVLIGLIPIIIRLLIYAVVKNVEPLYYLNEVDIVFFGLVLHVSNINELEDKSELDKNWKTTCIGLSLIMVVLFSALLAFSFFSDIDNGQIIQKNNIKVIALIMGFASFVFSFSIFDRLNKQYNV